MTRFWEEFLHVVWGRSSRHVDLPDVRGLPTRSVAVGGTQYLVHDRERRGTKDRLYVLRAGTAPRDRGLITVYSDGRMLGRLSDDVSASLGSALERVGGAVIVNGSGVRDGGIRLWVDVPTAGAFADYADRSALADV